MAAVQIWFRGQTRGVHTWGDREAVRQGCGTTGVVAFIHAVGRRRFASPPDDGLIQCGDSQRHWRVRRTRIHATGL